MTDTDNTAFEKARTGLWTSLQKHLTIIYEAESTFLKAVPVADDYPFPANLLTAEQTAVYDSQRAKLRDLFVDETAQLDSLVKAVRMKAYSEDEKKQLFLLVLGYIDIAESVFLLSETHIYSGIIKREEEQEETLRFDRVKKFVRLNVKGINSLLGTLAK